MKKAHRPQLIIDTQKINEGGIYDNFIDETSKYSITPTTFKGRALRNLEAPIFQELYQFKYNTVNRFGLNIKSNQLLKEISEYNDKEIEKVKTPSIATTVKEKDIKKLFDMIYT